jgi:hypothetical protein
MLRRAFRVFVSSTFADMHAERNALQRLAVPELDRRCRERGFRFQAIDLRWGVRDEVGLSQATLDLCLEEVRRCRQVSPRPNFLVLLGDRYGWRPVPARVDAAEFTELAAALTAPDRDLLDRWYRLDGNALEPTYLLLPRSHAHAAPERWAAEEAVLRAAFGRAIAARGWPANDTRRHKYEDSATHQEIRLGALEAPDAAGHVLYYQRTFTDLPAVTDPQSGPLADWAADGSADADARARLAALRQDLRRLLPPLHVREQPASVVSWPDTEALTALAGWVVERLWAVIEGRIAETQQQSGAERESEAHRELARERAGHFHGRSAERAAIRSYLADESRAPLVLRGPSGSGKTALLACAAEDAAAGGGAVVRRFLGTTSETSRLRDLLEGLCREVGSVYGRTEAVPTALPDLLAEWPRRLALARPDRPLVVVLDALDQLDPSDNARALLWLPRELPAGAKLVASVLAEPAATGLPAWAGPGRDLPLGELSAADGKAILDAWLRATGRTLQPAQRDHLLARLRGCPSPLFLKLLFEGARRWPSFHDPGELPADVPGAVRAFFERLGRPAEHGPLLVRAVLAYLCAARRGLAEDELIDLLSADADFFLDFLEHAHHALPPGQERLPTVVWVRLYHDLLPYLGERRAFGETVLSFYHGRVADEAAGLVGPEAVRSAHETMAGYFAGQPNRFAARPNHRRAGELPYQLLRAGRWDDLAGLFHHLAFLEAKAEAGEVLDLAADFHAAAAALPPGHPAARLVRLLADALRLDGAFLHRHPTALFQCLWNRCWWHDCPEAARHYAPPEGGWGAEQPPWAGGGAGLHRLLQRWRAAKEAREPGFLWLRLLRPPPERLGQPLHLTLRDQSATVQAVAFSPGGELLASAVGENIAAELMPGGGGAVPLVMGAYGVTRVDLDDPVTAERRGGPTVRLWDAVTGQPLWPVAQRSDVMSLHFDPAGQRLLTTGRGGEASLWDVSTGRPAGRLAGLSGVVTRGVFSPDGRRIATSGTDGTVRLWDAISLQELRCLGGHAFPVQAVAFSPDGRLLASCAAKHGEKDQASGDPAVRVWDASTGQSLLLPHPSGVTDVAFLPDGKALVSACNDGFVRVWWLDAPRAPRVVMQGHSSPAWSVSVSPDGVVTSDSFLAWFSGSFARVSCLEIEQGSPTESPPPTVC